VNAERFFDGVKKYDDDAVAPLKKSANELTRFLQNLQYLQPLAQNKLECVSDEEIKAGMCPACPFLEVELYLE